VTTYAAALALTVAVEAPLVAAVHPRQALRLAAVAAVATTATHLFMHRVLPGLVAPSAWLVTGEAIATVAEAAAYALATRDLPRALVASGLANAASFVAGGLLLR
jgi:hypothetical protein